VYEIMARTGELHVSDNFSNTYAKWQQVNDSNSKMECTSCVPHGTNRKVACKEIRTHCTTTSCRTRSLYLLHCLVASSLGLCREKNKRLIA
jgi:hypothetical protein